MALVVEDGTGVNNAESYVTLEYLNAYHLARGNSKWDEYLDEEKEAAARRAMTYIETFRYKGQRVAVSQACAFPRTGLITRDGLEWPSSAIPAAVKQAQAEGALKEAVSPGTLLPDWEPGKGPKRREKLGELEDEWFKQDPKDGKYPFQAILRLLADFILDPTADTSKTLYVFDVERT